jgi:membrane protease subunit HflC
MNLRLIIAASIGALFAIIVARSVFTVDEDSQAIVLRFGAPVRVVNLPGRDEAGLHLKAPWEQVVRLDRASVGFDALPAKATTSDQQVLVVEPYLRFRITDPLAFHQSLNDETQARERLLTLATAAAREAVGQASAADLTRGRRDAIAAAAAAAAQAEAARERLGIQVIDVTFRRVDPAEAETDAIVKRMRSEREQQAAQARALGDDRRRAILAQADADAAVIRANGEAAAERTRADADSQRAQIFAASFGKDPDFAKFYRAMQAYDQTLGDGGAVFVLSPDSDFLKYMKAPPAGR